MGNEILKFTINIPPSVNNYLMPIRRGKFVRNIKTPETRKYEKYLKKYIEDNKKYIEENWTEPNKHQKVDVDFSFYFKKVGTDPNNHFKIIIDVLNDCDIFYDDDMVLPNTVNTFVDRDNPRVDIVISKRDNIGVFKNRNQYNYFYDNNCFDCKNNKRCAILKDLSENIVRKEVIDNKCSKKVKRRV